MNNLRLVLPLILAGCTRSATPDPSRMASLVPQRLVNESDQLVATAELDNQGRLAARLTLALDYIPPRKKDEAVLPLCLNYLDKTFEIGTLTCKTSVQDPIVLLVGHFDQECLSEPTVKKKPAEVTPTLTGCSNAEISTHVFDPEITVLIEAR